MLPCATQAGWRMGTYRTGGLIPAEDPVIRDVAEDQVALRWCVCAHPVPAHAPRRQARR